MLAFHNDPAIKEKYLARVRAHEAADEITKGLYWENGRGCAVGCSVHSSDHAAYETEMGIPSMLARLEDRIFEGMSDGNAKRFPVRFIDAVHVGADLSLVGWKFLHWLVSDVVARHGTDNVKAATVDAIEILRRKSAEETVSNAEACEAGREARRAAAAADAAAAYAAAAAAAADAAYAAYAADAADAADAYAAAYAAYAADAAAAYAAADAYAAAAAYAADAAADAAARQKAYDRQAEKLLEFLAECRP